MKFVRQTVAVVAVVAVIMVFGVLWKHSGAAGLVADGGGGPDRRQTVAAPPPPGTNGSPRFDGGFGRDKGKGSLSLSHVDDLVQTLLIEGGVLAGVVLVDRTRRRLQPNPRIPVRR